MTSDISEKNLIKFGVRWSPVCNPNIKQILWTKLQICSNRRSAYTLLFLSLVMDTGAL